LQKTWQRLRTAGIFHDAVPHPGNRIGYPMHVKVTSLGDELSLGFLYSAEFFRLKMLANR